MRANRISRPMKLGREAVGALVGEGFRRDDARGHEETNGDYPAGEQDGAEQDALTESSACWCSENSFR